MAIGTTAAIIGGSVLGAGASIASGSMAAGAQRDAASQSASIQKYIYDTTRADNEPSRLTGQNAMFKLADLYGVSRPASAKTRSAQDPYPVANALSNLPFGGGGYIPATTTTEYTMTPGSGGFEASPGYNFRLKEGLNALNAKYSPSGRLMSGSALKGITDYAQGRASDEFNNYTNALRSLAGLEQTANVNNQNAGMNYASGASNALQNAGNARASSYANIGSSINSGINNALTAYLYSKSPILNPQSSILTGGA